MRNCGPKPMPIAEALRRGVRRGGIDVTRPVVVPDGLLRASIEPTGTTFRSGHAPRRDRAQADRWATRARITVTG